jgi:hypothetical protein
VLLVDRKLFRRERKSEQRREKRALCLTLDGDLTRVVQRIGRHITHTPLQANGLKQTAQIARASQVEVVGRGLPHLASRSSSSTEITDARRTSERSAAEV